jgi:cell division protein FtsB
MGAVQGATVTDTLERDTDAARVARRRRWGWVLAVLLLGALALTVSGIFPFRQLVAQQRQIERATEQFETLSSENDRLEVEIAALQTDDEVERIARDQYGLVRPGEVGYVVVSPPQVDATLETVPVEESSDTRSWWVRLWDFITGSDLSDGG